MGVVGAWYGRGPVSRQRMCVGVYVGKGSDGCVLAGCRCGHGVRLPSDGGLREMYRCSRLEIGLAAVMQKCYANAGALAGLMPLPWKFAGLPGRVVLAGLARSPKNVAEQGRAC